MKTQKRKVQLAKNKDEIQTSNSEMTENEESEEELQDELESDLELEQSYDELEDSDSENQTKCPLCSETFFNKSSARRHLGRIHKTLSKLEFNSICENMKETKHKCQYCRKMVSRVKQHKKACLERLEKLKQKCLKTRVSVDIETMTVSNQEDFNVYSLEFVFWEKLRNWEVMMNRRTNKKQLKNILSFWKIEINNFTSIYNLITPEKSNFMLPSLRDYLKQKESPRFKKSAILAYVDLIQFIIDTIEDDQTMKPLDKMSYVSYLENQSREFSKQIKNLETKICAEVSFQKSKDETRLKFNPERMFELLKVVLSSTQIFEVLAKKREEEDEEGCIDKKEEFEARSSLIGLICATTGGLRPGFTTNMTIANFREGKTSKVVKVLSPNGTSYGRLRFSMPGLYTAVSNYIKIYRTGATGKDFVFVNARGGKADRRPGNDWMKSILSGELNAEEKRNLSLDCWSAAWTQWKVEEEQGSKKRWIYSLAGKSNSIEISPVELFIKEFFECDENEDDPNELEDSENDLHDLDVSEEF